MSNVCLQPLHRTVLTFARPLSSQFTSYLNLQSNPIWINQSLRLSSPTLSSTRGCTAQSVLPQIRVFTSSSLLFAGRRREAAQPTSAPIPSFTEKEIQAAFGQAVNRSTGNRILRNLHRRRVSGSLVERGVYIEGSDIPDGSLTRALEWLRGRFPVDEEAAVERWATKNIAKLESQYDKEAQEIGIEQDVYSRPGNRSVHDDMRLLQAKKAKEEEERREKSGEAQQERELKLVKANEAEQATKTRALALAEKRKKKEEDAYIIKGDKIPEMTMRQRLLPSTILTLLIFAFAAYFSDIYVPPSTTQRLWNDIPPSVATVVGLGISMLTITFLWHIPRFWKILNRTCVVSTALPYPLALFGGVFSHQSFRHLGANMAFMSLYGISLHEDIGRGNFLAIFFTGGVVGSMTSLIYHVRSNMLYVSTSGASGGVVALIFAWIYLNATNSEGVMEAPTNFSKMMKVCGYAFVIYQIPMHLQPSTQTMIDVWSHLGGAVFGLVAAVALKIRAQRKDKEQTSTENGKRQLEAVEH